MGHGETGSVADREQFEAGCVPKSVSRGSWEGAAGLGPMGTFLLHRVPGPHLVMVCICEEGEMRDLSFFFFFLYLKDFIIVW